MIKKDIRGGCGAEALRVINSMPNWIPGTKDGKAVDIEMALPVSFKLAPDNVDADEVYNVVDEMPRFKNEDCEKMEDQQAQKKCLEMAMLKFIYSNVKYPKAARDAGVQGTVIIKFVVQKDGSIADAKILRDAGGGCGAEAERVVNSMPNFVPGKQKGEAVKVSYTLPIRFKLAEPDTKMNIRKLKDIQGEGDKPLFVVNRKIVDVKVVEDINPNQIEHINVLKGDAAKEKYPQAGKDGVIEIQLKREPFEKKDALGDTVLSYVKISPNPTDGKINIEYESEKKPMIISILDINGKEIYRKKVEGGRSSLQDVDVSKAAIPAPLQQS